MRIQFGLPKLNDDQMEKLASKGVDSWLVRLKRRGMTSSQTLGYFSLQFVSPNPRTRRKYRGISSGSIGINFAAASVSMRLDSLPCPAFNHRKRVVDYGVKKNRVPKQSFSVSAANFDYISAKVEPISYSPVAVNGGMDLKGNYSIEVALFQMDGKRKRSSFIELAHVGYVAKSEEIGVKGCENYKVPDAHKKDTEPYNKFKFGR